MRQAVAMSKFQKVQVQDRNVDTWFDDYDGTMLDYNSNHYESDGVTINETMICDFSDTLRGQLGQTKIKIGLVRCCSAAIII